MCNDSIDKICKVLWVFNMFNINWIKFLLVIILNGKRIVVKVGII